MNERGRSRHAHMRLVLVCLIDRAHRTLVEYVHDNSAENRHAGKLRQCSNSLPLSCHHQKHFTPDHVPEPSGLPLSQSNSSLSHHRLTFPESSSDSQSLQESDSVVAVISGFDIAPSPPPPSVNPRPLSSFRIRWRYIRRDRKPRR